MIWIGLKNNDDHGSAALNRAPYPVQLAPDLRFMLRKWRSSGCARGRMTPQLHWSSCMERDRAALSRAVPQNYPTPFQLEKSRALLTFCVHKG